MSSFTLFPPFFSLKIQYSLKMDCGAGPQNNDVVMGDQQTDEIAELLNRLKESILHCKISYNYAGQRTGQALQPIFMIELLLAEV
jgi:hypothetical protein